MFVLIIIGVLLYHSNGTLFFHSFFHFSETFSHLDDIVEMKERLIVHDSSMKKLKQSKQSEIKTNVIIDEDMDMQME